MEEKMKKECNNPTGWGKWLRSVMLVSVVIFSLQVSALAAEPVLTVNTALNVELTATDDYQMDEPEPQEQQWVWHPISVINEPMNGFNAVRRTYALPPDVNPAIIATDDFEMFGQRFTFAHVLKQPTSDEAFKEMRETVTIEATSRNLNDILPYLEQEILFERDGFSGVLVLDIHSITSEVAGTSRTTSTATRQRSFPHLSEPDNSLIPRTITDGGTTFHLATVDWQPNRSAAIDGHQIAVTYTATVTYSAQVTRTHTTGYIVTAEYIGTVFRITQGKTLYTAIFYGEPIIEIWLEEPVPEVITEVPAKPEITPEPALPGTAGGNGSGAGGVVIIALAVLATLIALGAVGAGGFFLAKHFLGYNVTVYSINGPREIVKAGKIKMDLNSPEPTIILDKAVGQNPAKTDRYIIQIVQRAMPKLINKVVRVVLHDKEAFHKVPEKAIGVPVYEFEVNFSDDDEPDVMAGETGGYPFGGDASDS